MTLPYDSGPGGFRRQIEREIKVGSVTASGSVSAKLDADEFERAMAIVESVPPAPSGVLACHAVPFGRSFRQWDSCGRLWIWVNRGWLEDLPRFGGGGYEFKKSSASLAPGITGIRVYNVE